jgi:hypothetical protein
MQLNFLVFINAKLLILLNRFWYGEKMSPEDEEGKSKPAIVAKPVSDDEESESPPVAKAAKPTDDEDKDKDRGSRKEREQQDNRYYGPPQSQYPPQYPPPQPLFSKDNVTKMMTLGLIIGIICLFIASMLVAGGKLTDVTYDFDDQDDRDKYNDAIDFQNTMFGAAILMAGIGLFLISIFLMLPLLLIRDLDDKQKKFIIFLIGAVIIGFALLAI